MHWYFSQAVVGDKKFYNSLPYSSVFDNFDKAAKSLHYWRFCHYYEIVFKLMKVSDSVELSTAELDVLGCSQ